MTWLNSIFIALLTGGIGLLCGGLVMSGYGRWHKAPTYDAINASYMIVGVALLSGIVAGIVGLVTARMVAAGASPTFLKGLGSAAGIVVGVAVLAAGLGWLTGDHSPRPEAVTQTADGPTYEEQEAAKVKAEQAAFDAIPSNAPLAASLEYLKYGGTEGRQVIVLQRVTTKAGWIVELTDLMVTNDIRLAETALRFVQLLPQPPPELVAPVSAAGRNLAERIRLVNATTVEQDPRYEAAQDVSLRFNGWMAAIVTLHEKCGGDFVPELREILELSRVRNDSHTMRTDVRRVASYYLKEWAGVAPLPGDPPPN